MGLASDLTLLRHDGHELAVSVALSTITVDARAWYVASIRDDTKRRATQATHDDTSRQASIAQATALAAITASDNRFRSAFENSLAPMVFTDRHDRVLITNEAFCQLLGRTRDELIGRDSAPFTHPADVGISEQSLHLTLRSESGQDRYIKRYLHKDGHVVIAEVSRSPSRDVNGELLYFAIAERDITERVKRDQMLRLLSAVNKLAVLAIDEMQFLQQLCEVLVDVGGYALTWVGMNSPDEVGGVDVICAAGATDYLHGDMKDFWGTRESRLGMAGRALNTGVSQVVSDLGADLVNEAWRERAIRFGFGSAAAIIERVRGQTAVLAIYDREISSFDEMTMEGLEEVVKEAGFAIEHVRSVRRTEAALEKTTRAVDALTSLEGALTDSEQRFRLAFEDNMAPMVFSDLDDIAIAVNDAFCEMVGFVREELLGHDSTQFTFAPDVGITEQGHVRLLSEQVDQLRYTKRYQRKDGSIIVSEVSRSAARDTSGKILYFVSSERDITEERALTAQLSHQALHDPLTGLANRALFEDRLTHAHARAVREGGRGAVLLLDLDDFKGVNDTYGHLAGDELLMGIARRFELVTRSSDTLCRLGGDEFLYLAEGLTTPTEAEDVARRLLGVLKEPFVFDGLRFEQHASIGIVVWDETTIESGEIIQNADIALYEAKRHRHGGFALFTPSLHRTATTRFELAQDLRRALLDGELSMHYQPIVDLATTEVVGFESLMRWNHPVRGSVPPDEFIPMAEQSSLIVDLGAFALREAVAAASSWTRHDGAPPPYVTVNLSAHQFLDPGLVAMVEDVLEVSGLSPGRLILEITEGVALLDVMETLKVIDHLKRVGIGFALDDFGTGFSSLSYLVRLHPTIIKIDRYFVSSPDGGENSDTLLEMIITLGDKLQMTMLAEGIETIDQLQQLRELKCALGQGFLFSPAVPAREAADMVSRVFGI